MSWWFVVGHRRIRQYLHNFNNLILVILFQYAKILYFFYNEHFVTQQIHLAFPENVVMVLSTGYISPLLLPQTPSFPITKWFSVVHDWVTKLKEYFSWRGPYVRPCPMSNSLTCRQWPLGHSLGHSSHYFPVIYFLREINHKGRIKVNQMPWFQCGKNSANVLRE